MGRRGVVMSCELALVGHREGLEESHLLGRSAVGSTHLCERENLKQVCGPQAQPGPQGGF